MGWYCLLGEGGVHVLVEGGCDFATFLQKEGIVVFLFGVYDQTGAILVAIISSHTSECSSTLSLLSDCNVRVLHPRIYKEISNDMVRLTS